MVFSLTVAAAKPLFYLYPCTFSNMPYLTFTSIINFLLDSAHYLNYKLLCRLYPQASNVFALLNKSLLSSELDRMPTGFSLCQLLIPLHLYFEIQQTSKQLYQAKSLLVKMCFFLKSLWPSDFLCVEEI